jgi:hypothetical protein
MTFARLQNRQMIHFTEPDPIVIRQMTVVLFEMIVRDLTTCHKKYTCYIMWYKFLHSSDPSRKAALLCKGDLFCQLMARLLITAVDLSIIQCSTQQNTATVHSGSNPE